VDHTDAVIGPGQAVAEGGTAVCGAVVNQYEFKAVNLL
jgi:hypothetical protein